VEVDIPEEKKSFYRIGESGYAHQYQDTDDAVIYDHFQRFYGHRIFLGFFRTLYRKGFVIISGFTEIAVRAKIRMAGNRRREEQDIREAFLRFYRRFSYLPLEQLVECFSCFGGMENHINLDFFENTEQSVERIFVREFSIFSDLDEIKYPAVSPYRRFLTAVARGDGKMLGVFRRAHLNEKEGGGMLNEMVRTGILLMEPSREKKPDRLYPGQSLRKEFRGYRIQPKIHFRKPFLRFWFGFVEPFARELVRGEGRRFLENYRRHSDRAVSPVFGQLSNELLELDFSDKDPLVSKGAFWDRHNEFDLFCRTQSGSVILGECKYTGRPICRNELKKLKEKAYRCGIKADRFALFSRSGFSKELQEMDDERVMLYPLEKYRKLLKWEIS
jgi:hypothetical protein